MKLSLAAISLLALAGSSSAQYFSAGWRPGQAAQETTAAYVPEPSSSPEPAAPAQPEKPFSLASLLDFNRILTSAPAAALFSKVGINITEKVQAALDIKIWDERVELITDDNYKELIVNEPMTEQEEKDRVWIIVVSVTSAKQDGISKFLDEVFDKAFDESQLAGDLPHVKWGRVDYMNVTHITTKWGIWQAPYLVILKDRGQTLRFYRPYQIRLRDDSLREFLKVDGWKVTKPWSTAYAPGGDREYIMEFMAVWFTKIYNWVIIIPKWMLLFASGSIASVLIGLLHGKPKQPAPVPGVTKPTIPAAVARAPKAAVKTARTSAPPATANGTDSEHDSSAPTKRTSARQRKAKK
ncbi:hypothetical protein M413DRAFT_441609 [Hebeloma cylindrosporum]|uniref:Thioredoxin domain-containing protein n=1 Tax=Hebeloma cylindrosporum TaxID=76867 RepID=A0A0C3CQZ7_HEBCY|nr:hypothetical protein M413DRAFT_441609 [Hebeloma cylindrosporum h7]